MLNEVKPNVYREYICKSVLRSCHIHVYPLRLAQLCSPVGLR